jgi:hypothetical protein
MPPSHSEYRYWKFPLFLVSKQVFYLIRGRVYRHTILVKKRTEPEGPVLTLIRRLQVRFLAAGLRIFRHSSSFASTVPDEVAPIVTGDLAMQVLGRYEWLRFAMRVTPEAGSPLSPLRAG